MVQLFVSNLANFLWDVLLHNLKSYDFQIIKNIKYVILFTCHLYTFCRISHEVCHVTLSKCRNPTENQSSNKSRKVIFNCWIAILSSVSLAFNINS